MRHINKSHIIIFSVYQGIKTDEHNTDMAKHYLLARNRHFELLDGSWKGQKEESFLVLANDRPIVEKLCKLYKQECYLESFPDRSAELVYLTGSSIPLGQFKCLGFNEPANNTWTKDSSGLYWGCVA